MRNENHMKFMRNPTSQTVESNQARNSNQKDDNKTEALRFATNNLIHYFVDDILLQHFKYRTCINIRAE